MSLRQRLYEGEIIKFGVSDGSRRFVEHLRKALRGCAGVNDIRGFYARGTIAELNANAKRALAKVRDFGSAAFLHRILADIGETPDEYVFDLPRLRVVRPLSVVDNEDALPPHRDVWFAEPKSQINLWMSLFAVTKENSLAFWPEYFDRKLANTSAQFDSGEARRVASSGGRPIYPKALEQPHGAFTSHILRAGEVLAFSANHMHASVVNFTPQTRISVDFRVVHIEDYLAGRGAPSPDNGSRGSPISHYRNVAGEIFREPV